jgi:hypothetical protein
VSSRQLLATGSIALLKSRSLRFYRMAIYRSMIRVKSGRLMRRYWRRWGISRSSRESTFPSISSVNAEFRVLWENTLVFATQMSLGTLLLEEIPLPDTDTGAGMLEDIVRQKAAALTCGILRSWKLHHLQGDFWGCYRILRLLEEAVLGEDTGEIPRETCWLTEIQGIY